MKTEIRRAAAKNSAKNEDTPYGTHLSVLALIVSISAYGGIELGRMEFWEDLKWLRPLCHLLGITSSFMLAYLMPLRTLKLKKRLNLLWLGLPVVVMTVIESLWRSPSWRPLVLGFAIVVVLSSAWFQFSKRPQP